MDLGQAAEPDRSVTDGLYLRCGIRSSVGIIRSTLTKDIGRSNNENAWRSNYLRRSSKTRNLGIP